MHSIQVMGLRPSTSYRCAVKAVARGGAAYSWKGMCPTAKIGRAQLSTKNGSVLLNGSPFFMEMAYAYSSCPDTQVVKDNAAMGLNVFDHSEWGCTDSNKNSRTITADELHGLLANTMWWLERDPTSAQKLQQLPELLTPPGGISYTPNLGIGSCNTAADNQALGKYYAELKSMAQNRPVVFWTDISDFVNGNKHNCIDGPSMRALLWTVVAAGVQGVSLRTQVAADPFLGVKVKSDVSASVRQFTNQFAVIQAAVLGGKPLPLQVGLDDPIKYQMWLYGGTYYIIAVNTTSKPQVAKLSSTLLRGSTVQVMWEHRRLQLRSGSFTDNFTSLGVHVYKTVPEK